MSNDVVLTAALRSNLLSLQQTQSQIDTHQNNLATGKKVNSALDNPESFFQAASLTNRANSLSNLLDSIGQSIQVINAANNGVTALTSLVNQATSLAQSAQSTLSGASTTAQQTGTATLNSSTLLSTISGLTAAGGDKLIFTVTSPTAGAANPITTQTVATTSSETVGDLLSAINDLNDPSGTPLTSGPAISAGLDASGHLQLTAVNGGNLHVQFVSSAGTVAGGQNVATALGFGGTAKVDTVGTNSSVDFTATAANALTSTALYTTGTTLAQASSLLSGLKNASGTAVVQFTGASTGGAAADSVTIAVGGKTSAAIKVGTDTTIQGFIDTINHDGNIDGLISASFNATTGQLQITPTGAGATDAQITFATGTAGTGADLINVGFGTQNLQPGAASRSSSEDIYFGAAAGNLASYQSQYNATLTQINQLVTDTGYQGTNLLNGNNLTTTFDESGKATLVTQGVNFTASGLGLTNANFNTSASIGAALAQTANALNTVQNYGSTLAGNLSTIQTRQTFTTSLINTLQTGSDNLTNADQNEESADLLSLQTRQQLGVTALSLASQSQQSVLKLF